MKSLIPLVLLVMVIMAAAVFIAQAATPVAVSVALSSTAGSASWTNAWILKGAKLVSVEVFNSLNPTNAITVKRVRDGRTNTVCAITCTSNAPTSGSGVYYETTNSIYVFKDDVLKFTSAVSTGSTGEIVFELSP